MRTQKLFKLHKKACDIIEMIERAEARAKDARGYIVRAQDNRMSYHAVTLQHYERMNKKYSAVAKRLKKSYANVVQKLIEPAIERMTATPIGNIRIDENGYAQAVY